jgi:tetratricopeptide (TPR) repeat protein
MIPNAPRPDGSSAPTDVEVRRGTLPPPEWKRPAASGASKTEVASKSLVRRTGPRAEEGWMRARVEEARVAQDPVAFRDYAVRLARWLASRDRDLLEAAELASLALGFGEDVELRREMSSWLESLGESGRAAAALKPIAAMPDLDSAEAAYLMVRAGILKARAGAPAAAAVAFETAMSIDPSDPLAAQLFGGMWASDSDAVDPTAAAEAYREGARRQRILRRTDAELEDLWRAVSADPSNDQVATALAELLEGQGRSGAADEVRRACGVAVATDPARSARLSAQRLVSTAATHDTPSSLGAALDAGFDAALEGEDANAFDAVLLDVGLLETVAARLEVRSERAAEMGDVAAQAAHLVDLARLCAGPLADPQRAVGAWISAFASDPANQDALIALRGLLGPGERMLGVSLGVRGDPLRTLAQIVAPMQSARERRGTLVAELGRVLPDLGKEPPLADDGSDSRAATARAWVRASLGEDAGETAKALERVAVSTAAPLRAVLLASAARTYLRLGRAVDARRAAEAGARADPAIARAVASLADVVMGEGDRVAAAALEGAINAVGPRAEWCAALVDALESLGESQRLVVARERSVALRPGDRVAVERLLAAATASKDAPRLMETLAWLLCQPQPASWAAGVMGQSLRALSEMDAAAAAVVARRALDVFGAKATSLRVAMLVVADRASDDAFAAAVLERWLAFCPESPERIEIHLRLAALWHSLGDREGEARVLLRAVRAGAGSASVEESLSDLVRSGPASPDAELWTAMAEGERLATGKDFAAAAWSWRDLGAALWDLADDRVGAVAAWERATEFAPGDGRATLALDLLAFGGLDFAREYLVRLIDSETDDRTAAKTSADVGRAVLSAGEHRLAFDLAARGVTRCPARADVLELAERSADGAADRRALSGLYDLVAQRSLGRFGRRAAHYRGARYFDRSGERELALKHAAQAFYAVPSEGSSFHLLARAAERAGDRTHAARTVEQVAERAVRPESRAAWLLRAASILGPSEDETRRRVEMLLAAAVGAPSVGTVALLRDAVRDLLRLVPEEKEIVEMRFGRAANSVVEHVEGPDGARVSLAFAAAVLDLFADGDAAMSLFEHAFGSDADVDEFEHLASRGSAFAAARNAGERTAAMLATAEGPFGNVGIATLRCLAAIAAALGDRALEARAVVTGAMREPDSDALVIAADAAVRSQPSLGERLATKVAPARRVEALVGRARALVAEGAHDQAAPLFERAAGLADDSEREPIERALRMALDAAGRSAELEERVQREAASEVSPAAQRADRWGEIADRREVRGDYAGAVRALVEACKLDPQSLERWSALERVAEVVGDDATRVEALQQIAERVKSEGRGAVFKRLARAQERMGDAGAAVATWGKVLALDEHDEEADHSLEAAMAAGGRYAELVEHLAGRADRMRARSAPAAMLRAVRLRRAAILEQRLGRDEDACDELTLLLGESPDNAGALRYLADLLERRDRFAQSAPLWRRAAAIEGDPHERAELEMRAGLAFRSAGDVAMALRHANRVLAIDSTRSDARTLRIDAARALGSDVELGEALEANAGYEADPATKSGLLVEAAQVAARLGNASEALGRAQRAAETAPDRATPQLLARGLEYRLRGAGTRDDARRTVQQLERVTEPLARSDAALRAFLVAEAIDVLEGVGAGSGELIRVRETVGAHPLLALGLAERLAVKGDQVAAVDEYLAALEGSLLDLRRPGSVALAASDAALQCNRLAEAKVFIDQAERHAESRDGVESRRALLAERERPVARSVSPQPRPSTPPGAGSLDHLEAVVRRATTPGERARARLMLGRARLGLGDARAAEPLLWEALADGLVEAGDVLSPLVSTGRDRAPDLVRLRRQQALLEPGDPRRLQALREAALADDDRVYARAVEHVLRAFDPGAGPLPPPPLAHQPEQAGIFALLVRPSLDAAGEALSVLWEGASQMFVRDAASYGITGVERVVPGPTSVIARLHEASMRLLGTARVPLFLTRSTAAALSAQVALLSPPSVVLSGDVREDNAALRFALGRALSAAMPHNVLRLALPARDGRALVEALRAAFGSPEIGRRVDAHAARMAESFWQIVPARAQRRLQELLGSGGFGEYEDLVGRAQQSGRRVGMFLAGDFACAARVVVAESAPHLEASLSTQNLRQLCDELPALADLARLAVSREYADARWHVVAPPTQRGTMPSGRFSLF